MKTRVAEEAEESTTMISGSKGIIARCVAHLEHSLDGNRAVASHHGRDRAPTMYICTCS